MNKEAFRKELEDCWDAAAKKVYVDDYGPVPNKNPSKEQYITTRLAALWNEKNVKTKEEILEKHCSNYRKYLDKDHMTLYELSINGFECFHAMEEYASQFQSKHLDDGQEGEGLRWVKASERLPEERKVVPLKYHNDYFVGYCFFGKNGENLNKPIFFRSHHGAIEEYNFNNLEWLDKAALPVADGEGQKVGLKDEIIKLQDEYIDFLDQESSPFISFAFTHNIVVPEKVVNEGKAYREKIASLKRQSEGQPSQE